MLYPVPLIQTLLSGYGPHAFSMETDMSDNTKIPLLNESNYSTWSEDMQAMLRGKGLWRLVSEQEKCHGSDPNKQEECDNKAEKACGILTLGVEQLQ